MEPKRISMYLFDEELKTLINASAKIFPITQEDVDSNLNPNGYEYGKVDRSIYTWHENRWEYVVADDIDINWLDVKSKPLTFPPTEHTHPNDHSHSNKTLLDTLTQGLIDTWNSVTGKAEAIHAHDEKYYTKIEADSQLAAKADTGHTHLEADITDLDKYTKPEVDTKLAGKSDNTHNHDGAYYKKGEVDSKLLGKADKVHTHDYAASDHNHDTSYAVKSTEGLVADHETRLYNIENGYTEGHSHPNVSLLNSLTQALVDSWNSAVSHISDAIKHITAEERTLWNTVSGKAEANHTHNYAPTTHSHNDLYYTETEVDAKLGSKSDTGHTHTDKADKTYVDTELAKKVNSTTFSGHADSTVIHVTQTEKDAWNAKAEGDHTHSELHTHSNKTVLDNTEQSFTTALKTKLDGLSNYSHPATHPATMITGLATVATSGSYVDLSSKPTIPTKLSQLEADIELGGNFATIGTVKPTDGSMWYEVVG